MFKLFLLLLCCSLVLVGCRPEEESTSFSVTDRMVASSSVGFDADDPLLNNICALPPEDDKSNAEMIFACENQADRECQAIYEKDAETYRGCYILDDDGPRDDSLDDDPAQTGDPTQSGDPTQEDVNDNNSSTSQDCQSKKRDPSVYTTGCPSSIDPSSGNNSFDELADVEGARCDSKGKKVFVCHTNNGSKKMVTICIAIPAWLNAHQPGHKGHWGEDKLGTCQ